MSSPAALAVQQAVLQAFGISVSDDQSTRLAPLVEQAIAAGLTEDLQHFQRHAQAGGPLTRWLAERVTIDESYFFRNLDHFQAVTDCVIPALVQRRGRGTLRVLSAGCSRGQEAYSLAMVLDVALRGHPGMEWEVTGIDVNPANIEIARGGRYSAWSFRTGLPPAFDAMIEQSGADRVVQQRLRARVRFEERNLTHADSAFWRAGAFDLVFFRNVAIYFGEDVFRAVIARICHALEPNGFLFVSESESLRGVSDDFELRQHGDAMFYERGRKATSAVSVPPVVRAPAPRPLHAPRPSLAAPQPTVEDLERLARDEQFSTLAGLRFEARDTRRAIAVAVGMLSTGNRDGARAVCIEVLATSPNTAEAHHVLALCQRPDQVAATLAHGRSAIAVDPHFALARLHLALALVRASRRDLAAAEFDAALAALPQETSLRLALFGGGLAREALANVIRSARRSCAGAN